ncbi:DUF748 domain-containing protein [candidate division WWE3 bacterium]|uniref:DUF748 domain-containing protein n=1 Tax=candidate division WWE3 bacterium TaxID=2053526 RepID=A0A928Y635_UNCKA|nr:DUF748 domain-containing protein [candidate division WWE3 bacterium]
MLTREGEKEPALSFAKLVIPDITINTATQKIGLGTIALDGFSTTLRRDAQGNLDLSRLFSPAGTPAQTAQTKQQVVAHIPIPARKPSRPASPVKITEKVTEQRDVAVADTNNKNKPDATEKPWTPQLKSIQLKAAKLRYEDLSMTKVTPMIVDSLDLTLDDIDLDGIKPLQLTMQGRVNQHGSIKASGALAWSPLAADLLLDLTAVDLVSLQGWLGDKLTALLTSGDISFAGNIKAGGEPLKIQVNGDGKLANFNIFDSKMPTTCCTGKLDINRFNFSNDPLHVDIGALYLSDFFARMTILPDGSLNLKQIIQTENRHHRPQRLPQWNQGARRSWGKRRNAGAYRQDLLATRQHQFQRPFH